MKVIQAIRRKLFSPQGDFEDIHDWREHVLASILLVAVVLGGVVAVPSVLFSLSERLWSVAAADVIALVWVLTIWHKRALGFRARAWNFCALLYLLGLSFLVTVGVPSLIYLMAFPVVAALLLGLRPALLALVLNATTLLGVGYAVDANLQIAGFEGQPLLKWIVITMNFSFVNAVITISIAVLLRGMEKSLERKRQSEELYRVTFEKASIGVSRLDLHGRWLQVNHKLCEITGYSQQEMLGLRYQDITHPEDTGSENAVGNALIRGEIADLEREKRYIRKDGSTVWVHLRTSLIRTASGEPNYFVAVAIDVTERKKAEKRINELAFFDQLTGLPNRILLLDRLKQTMAASSRDGSYGALLFIDLDNFKTLNDTLGHDMGDLLLKQVAQRLCTCVREGDTVARLGGDEFVLMLASMSMSERAATVNAETVTEKILAALNQTYPLGSVAYHSTPSIGVTLFTGQQVEIDDLMKQADLAMYKAKAAGRNAVRFFDPDMESAVMARAALEADLRQAIRQKQFVLHYQAQVVEDGRLTGVEGLVRWQHPQRGMVSPADFIPTAEETGLILPLGHWVLHTACTQLTAWATQPELAHLTVAVNVSAHQFHQRDFVDRVLSVLRDTGANPQQLKLELTESLLVANVEDVIEKMFALKAKGVGFSLDDFGTGFSSLSYLKRMPLDQLKIDRSFVRDVLSDPNDAAIAKTIIALAQSLGLDVIAEGVETAAQRDFLRQVGCHAYQGYFFGRPLPIDDFEAFAQRAVSL